MFSIVHVILPFSELSPAEAIRDSLAPFARGGRGDVPDEWLAFDDKTEHVRAMHTARWIFTDQDKGGLRIEGGEHWHLDFRAIRAEMASRGLRQWTVQFAETEPDLAAFVDRYVEKLERHPITGGFGRWLNPLGRWDWWDLGGRFDGRIIGERRRQGRPVSRVSSGPSAGRAVLENVHGALEHALGSASPPEIDVRADDNIEMVSRLLDDARAGLDHAIPSAILLPPGSVDDRLRWLRSWPEIDPIGTLSLLGLSGAVSMERGRNRCLRAISGPLDSRSRLPSLRPCRQPRPAGKLARTRETLRSGRRPWCRRSGPDASRSLSS